MKRLRFVILLTLISGISIVACSRGLRVLDPAPELRAGNATVTGIVTGPGDKGEPIPGSTVVAINQSTGERYTAVTNSAGGYTLSIPAGTYRLDLDLPAGQVVGKRPLEPIELEVGEIETRMDFQLQLATANRK